jgi:hypothetical protein
VTRFLIGGNRTPYPAHPGRPRSLANDEVFERGSRVPTEWVDQKSVYKKLQIVRH